MEKVLDCLNIDNYQEQISKKINDLKSLSFRRAKSDFAFKGRAVEGIGGEKFQDHYVPLYWFGRAVLCEHQSWINDEFNRVLGLAIGPYFEWMSSDDPSDSGWTDEDGSPEFTPIKTLNNNQLTCSSNIVEAILQSNIVISMFGRDSI